MTTNLLDRLVDLERRPDARPYTAAEYNLDGFRRWIASMGDPIKGVPWIHIAGTKGKGSTAALCESILHAAGLRTALYTSPHLEHYGQRYRFDTHEWTLDQFNGALARVEPYVDQREVDPHVPPNTFRTVFEVLTAIAFREFAANNVQVGILEVGLGGRLDCTNIVTPAVTIITSIGFDHTNILGNTLEEIAAEKAGIIKPGVPLVLFPEPSDTAIPRNTILRMAKELGAPVLDPIPIRTLGISDKGQHVSFTWNSETVTTTLPLIGAHQLQNLGLALRACEVFASLYPSSCILGPSSLSRGVSTVRWQGRFEIINTSPTIVLDGAHCPLSAAALGSTLRQWLGAQNARIHLVWGMQGDKDHASFLSSLAEALSPATIDAVHCYTVPGKRGAPGDTLARVAATQGIPTSATVDVETALHQARGAIGLQDVMLVAGSLYTLETARQAVINA